MNIQITSPPMSGHCPFNAKVVLFDNEHSGQAKWEVPVFIEKAALEKVAAGIAIENAVRKR